MHIMRIGVNRLPPMGGFYFDCDERVNLFIGPNASGKSTVLRAMSSAYSGEIHRAFSLVSGGWDLIFWHHDAKHILASISIDVSDDWPRDSDSALVAGWDTVPLLYIPATRVNLPGMHIFRRTIEEPENIEIDAPFKRLFDTGSDIFYGQYVDLAISWLRERMIDPQTQQNQLGKALGVGYSCVKSICREIIYDDTPHPYIELRDKDEGGKDEGDEDAGLIMLDEETAYETDRIVHYGMGIGTTDNVLGEPLYAGALSSGTQGTLLWIWALALKMASHYDWEASWEKQPAILLIDEIENHLHPTWQRRVIPALLEHFPGLQIFATTHSPFVVAGLKAGQVHLLKRDENGVVTASTNTEDVIGWTADEILRTMMGVEEPTDQLTVDRANRLRQLREKGTLTPEEESELNGLRRQVNEDLLAKGGPLEVERERYADLMRSFLLSRQSELTQDTE